MSSKRTVNDHRFYKIRGKATSRKDVKNGSRTKTKPGVGYFRECPLCLWQMNQTRKQQEPVRVTASTRVCPNGHKVF